MKNSWIENPNGENMLYCLFYTEIFFFFGGISKFHLWVDWGRFWQVWAVLGSFGQNLLH